MQILANTYQYIPIHAFVLNSQYKPNTYSIHTKYVLSMSIHTKYVLSMYWALNTDIGIQYKPIHTGETTDVRLGRFSLWISAEEFPPDDNNPKFLLLCFCSYTSRFKLPTFVALLLTVGLCHVPIGSSCMRRLLPHGARGVHLSCRAPPASSASSALCSGKFLLIISIMPVMPVVLIIMISTIPIVTVILIILIISIIPNCRAY